MYEMGGALIRFREPCPPFSVSALEKLHAPDHLVDGQDLVDQNQTADDLAGGVVCLMTVGDLGVILRLSSDAKEVSIVRDDHASLSADECQLLLVWQRA